MRKIPHWLIVTNCGVAWLMPAGAVKCEPGEASKKGPMMENLIIETVVSVLIILRMPMLLVVRVGRL